MDVDLERKVNEAIEQIRKLSLHDIDFDQFDPVAKMMLIALINECQKIQDYIEDYTQRIIERFCSDFIPREKVGAIPALALISPTFKVKKDYDVVMVGSGSVFAYKTANINSKQSLNYIPLFNTALFPYSDIYVLTSNNLSYGQGKREVDIGKKNCVWFGITTKVEIDCLKGMSFLIKGTDGILPEHIFVGNDKREIDFSTIQEMENIEMAEPFDAQQSSGTFFSFVNVWKDCMLNLEDASLIYLTDSIQDRDIFKTKAYPRFFQQWLEDEVLDCFVPNTLWLQLEFPDSYVVPDSFELIVNVIPVVNVDVNSLTLTSAMPIAKLQKQEDSFFLKVIETSSQSHKQGFNMTGDEIIIRDFDSSCYHNGDLYRDIRTLYNRFLDDYNAFIEYNGIKDGEVLKSLRETINRIGKSVGEKNTKFKFDSGTYVMKNLNQYPSTMSTKVNYITTQGEVGNMPQIGDVMENKKLPSIELKVPVVVSGMGGADKASVDDRYELLRYYALTNDRLYTKMDIEAFLRKELLTEFGSSEHKRIYIRINIAGAGGKDHLQRGLYIDVEFKDRKNYDHAVHKGFDKRMKQKIEGHSCISMPIVLTLKNLEE